MHPKQISTRRPTHGSRASPAGLACHVMWKGGSAQLDWGSEAALSTLPRAAPPRFRRALDAAGGPAPPPCRRASTTCCGSKISRSVRGRRWCAATSAPTPRASTRCSAARRCGGRGSRPSSGPLPTTRRASASPSTAGRRLRREVERLDSAAGRRCSRACSGRTRRATSSCNPPFYDVDEAAAGPPLASSCAARRRAALRRRRVVRAADDRRPGERGQVRVHLAARAEGVAKPLLAAAHTAGACHVTHTEIAQGSTSRWALGWSFVADAAPPPAAPRRQGVHRRAARRREPRAPRAVPPRASFLSKTKTPRGARGSAATATEATAADGGGPADAEEDDDVLACGWTAVGAQRRGGRRLGPRVRGSSPPPPARSPTAFGSRCDAASAPPSTPARRRTAAGGCWLRSCCSSRAARRALRPQRSGGCPAFARRGARYAALAAAARRRSARQFSHVDGSNRLSTGGRTNAGRVSASKGAVRTRCACAAFSGLSVNLHKGRHPL